jgi:hypothetical protein
MDYSIILVFSLILFAFINQVWYNYFKSGAKISDKQLMKNYISLTMKQHHRRYFPKMIIRGEYE